MSNLSLVPAPPPAHTLCSHCRLPLGKSPERREVAGEMCTFCCYGCSLAYQFLHGAREEPEAGGHLIRIGIGAFLAMNIMLLSVLLYVDAFAAEDARLAQSVPWLLWGLTTALFALVGGPFVAGAWRAAQARRLSADSLVVLGAAAAYGYSAWQVLAGGGHIYFDTVTMVLLLFTLGRFLEAQGRARAVRSLAPMLAAERAGVRVMQDGRETLRAASLVRAGEVVRVLPGERIAVDGVVLEGHSECDESLRSGQADPQRKGPGDAVIAGSRNGGGLLLLRVSVDGDGSYWSGLSRLVREALEHKTMLGETVDRAAALFIPCVLLLAVATVIYWGGREGVAAALPAGLAVLVVACPCALGLAAPLATAQGLARAAERGIVLRGGGVLERLAQVHAVALDKTGTITEGRLRPLAAATRGAPLPLVLRRAGALALGSDHPVARAVVDMARAHGAVLAAAAEVQAHLGAGLCGEADGVTCALGSAAHMAALGWTMPPGLDAAALGGDTQVYVGWDGRVYGRLSLADQLRPEAGPVLAALQSQGRRALLLSGDGAQAVAPLARTLGIDDWHGGLMPPDKVALLKHWAAQHGPVAMVGDGLNDGPVLAAAAVGIAMGGASDLARESADVILPAQGLEALPWLLQLADEVQRSVRANLAWAFGYNLIALALAAAGLLQPVLAAVLMAGSSLLVVLRSLRAGRAKTARTVTAQP
jgi:Cu2+-exporting ATPase